MPNLPLVLLLLTVAGAAFWYDSLRARERVMAACRRACREVDLQLLDETIALEQLRLVRSRGRLCWARHYRFEFSRDGADRWPGFVQLIGRQVTGIQLKQPEGETLLQRD